MFSPTQADRVAFPFFVVLLLYFVSKPSKTPLEWVLTLFAAAGVAVDGYFAFFFTD